MVSVSGKNAAEYLIVKLDDLFHHFIRIIVQPELAVVIAVGAWWINNGVGIFEGDVAQLASGEVDAVDLQVVRKPGYLGLGGEFPWGEDDFCVLEEWIASVGRPQKDGYESAHRSESVDDIGRPAQVSYGFEGCVGKE